MRDRARISFLRSRGLPALYFGLPAALVVAGVLVPLVYLCLRAFEAEASTLRQLVFRARTLQLFLNTALLAVGVLGLGSAMAFPFAWLTTRTRLWGHRFFALLGVLPLAIPAYVMAYALLGVGGSYGVFARLLGLELPRLSGYSGALLALTFYTFPYLFLNLRSALMGLDPALEETARSLGSTPTQVYFQVIIPQLRPAFYAGALLVLLHVLGDFGAVSLMRFETFSYALFLQYEASLDRIYAAWLALMLLALTGAVLFTEARFLKGLSFHRVGTASSSPPSLYPLGLWQAPAYLFLIGFGILSVGLPLFILGYWFFQGHHPGVLADLWDALWASTSASIPAALGACALALPLAYLSVRYPSKRSRFLERMAYFGYAVPPLALALAFIFFTLQALPFLYQTLTLLIIAYMLHFLAEAIGPLRSALYQAPPQLEEAARSLGYGPLQAFFRVVFPSVRKGLFVGLAFVFLASMKELPLTFLLAPVGFHTLAVNVWSYTHEALFGDAAAYALTIVLFSAGFVGLLLLQKR